MRHPPQRDPEIELAEALALHRAGDLDQAENAYRIVLASESRHFGVLTLLGTLYLQRGELDKGIRLLERSLKINPDQPNACNSRGNALGQLKRYSAALMSYDRAIALDPDFAEAFFNRGVVLKNMKRFDDALASYGRAIALRPDYARAYNNRGNILDKLERHEEALRDYDHALALEPDNAFAHANRGNALSRMKHYDEALASYDRAIALQPDHAEAHFSQGGTLHDMKRYDEALACYDRVIALEPDHANALVGKGRIKIMLGEWEEGWKLHERRWKQEGQSMFARQFRQPLWLGEEDPSGKTILLHAEQGLGDTIMMCRYAPLVEAFGAKVVIEVPAALFGLIATVSATARIVVRGAALPAFDLHCPLMSLPLAFKTTVNSIPATIPYLAAEPRKQAEWRQRLGAKTRPRIGLVWSGSGRYTNQTNPRRDIPFAAFRRLIAGDHDYYCLQKNIRPEDKQLLVQHPEIRIFENMLDNFSDTAALAAEMDLIISVDTAAAHLAGALGKPVWILLPDPPDYMSMLEREDSPWYPTARLFRQSQPGNWESVVGRVKRELEKI